MMFKLNKMDICVLLLVAFAFVLMSGDAYAAFETLKTSGKNIFIGLKKIIYPASAIGIIMICIGGFFGNINWKWLTAIFVGLIVIALCGAFITVFVGSNDDLNDKNMSAADILAGK